MFGCIVAGRLIQTNLQQLDETSFVFPLENAGEINHLTVFLLGTVPFPEGYGATVHLQFPGLDFRPLGSLTNARPSAIYRIKSLRPESAQPSGTVPATAVLGIQITTMDQLPQAGPANSGSAGGSAGAVEPGALVRAGPAASVGRTAEKIVKNLFNYLHSFEGGPATLTPETPIPLGIFQKWYDGFLTKIRYDDGAAFLERED